MFRRLLLRIAELWTKLNICREEKQFWSLSRIPPIPPVNTPIVTWPLTFNVGLHAVVSYKLVKWLLGLSFGTTSVQKVWMGSLYADVKKIVYDKILNEVFFGLRNDRKSTVKQHYHHFYTKFNMNTLVYKGEASLHFWCFFLEWCATRMCHRICWKLLCTVQIGQLTPLRHGNHKQLKLLCWRECCVHITAEPEAMNTGDHSRVHWFRGKSQMYIFTLQTKARC